MKTKQKIQKNLMLPHFRGITFLLLMFCLNWSALGAGLMTSAMFIDSGIARGNIFGAASLDFNATTTADFLPGVGPGVNATGTAVVENLGTLDFYYQITTSTTTGELCDLVNLTAAAATSTNPAKTDSLVGYLFEPGRFGTTGGDWNFSVELKPDAVGWEGQTCDFYLILNGSQNPDPTQGFSFAKVSDCMVAATGGAKSLDLESDQEFILEDNEATRAAGLMNATTTEGNAVGMPNATSTQNAAANATTTSETGDTTSGKSLDELLVDLGIALTSIMPVQTPAEEPLPAAPVIVETPAVIPNPDVVPAPAATTSAGGDGGGGGGD